MHDRILCPRRVLLAATFLSVLVLIPPGARAEVLGLADVTNTGTPSNNLSLGESGFSISGNGRFIGFQSRASNLPGCVGGIGVGGALHGFVHDRLTRTTSCVTVNSSGVPAAGGANLGPLSGDGRFVLLLAKSTNLATPCGNGPFDNSGGTLAAHVYLRDTIARTTTCMDVAANGSPGDAGLQIGGGPTGGGAFDAAISADGRFVAFSSNSTNLVAGCVPPGTIGLQVFLRDRVAGTISCASVNSNETPANVNLGGGSFAPQLSADGGLIVFQSKSTNLDLVCTNGQTHVFVRDRILGTTACVSVNSSGVQGNIGGGGQSISGNGRFVAFLSNATNLVTLPPGTVAQQLYVRDRGVPGVLPTTTLASVGADGLPDNGGSTGAGMSADGRFVSFFSRGTNLDPACRNGVDQGFVRDRQAGLTTCVSLGLVPGPPVAFVPGNAASSSPVVGGGGDARFAVFSSTATNLVPGVTTGLQHVYIARLPAGPNWLLAAPAGVGVGGGLAPVRADRGELSAFNLADHAVQGFDAAGGTTLLKRAPYQGWGGAVRLAYGDVTGDGVPEVITAAGPGGGPHVKVFTDTTASTELASFFAYDPAFRGGVFVAACDVDGTGKAAIVTGAGPGGGPHVRVWKLTGNPAQPVTELAGFFAYDPRFLGGVHVACGNVDGSAQGAIVTGAGPGGGPHVRVWKLNPLREVFAGGFFAYDQLFTGGVRVAVGDLEGTGKGQVITGAGPGGGPHVRSFDVSTGALVPRLSFFAYVPEFAGGVIVAAGDTTGSGRGQVITGPGPGGGPHVRTYNVVPMPQKAQEVPDKSFMASTEQGTGAEVTGPPMGEGGGGGGL